jgi:hypothetical protein
MRWCRPLLVGVVLVALSACAGGSESDMTERAANELALRVQRVRDSTLEGDRAVVERELERLRANVVDLRENGDLDRGRARAILEAAADVEGAVGLVPTTTAPPPPPPVVEDDDEDQDEGEGGEGKDEGKGKGEGKGEGDDD